MIAKEPFLFFLTTQLGGCYYVNQSSVPSVVGTTNQATWLPQAPGGWMDIELSFGRNAHYFGLNRSYAPSMKFVGDGAQIIRYYLYSPSGGTETKIYLNVCKWDPGTGIYQPYYKGEVDLTQATDNPLEGVTCSILEGGLLKLIKAYEKTMFEFLMDGSIPENFNLNIHGIQYNCILNYTVVPFNMSSGGNIIPLILQSETGMDVGTAKNNQQFGTFAVGNITTLINSGNYSLSFAAVPTGGNVVTITGTIALSADLAHGQIVLYTSLGNQVGLSTAGPMAAGVYILNGTITLAAGENLFITITTSDPELTAQLTATDVFVQFNSQLTDTVAICVRPYDLLNLLMQKISAAASTPQHNVSYGIQSNLLQQYSNLSLTSGQALRQQTPAVLKTCLSDFFDSFNALLNASLGNQGIDTGFGEILFLENKFYVFDSSQVTYMIAQEVQGLEIAPATDLQFDVVKFGYPEQHYDDASGNQEYNTALSLRTPITKISKTLSLVSIYRGDSNGIEATRVLTQTTNVSNNSSDNSVFIVNVDFTANNLTETTISGTAQKLEAPASNPTNINPPQFNSITGTIFAENFALHQNIVPDDSIAYSGPTTQIALKAILAGQFYVDTFATQTFYPTYEATFTLFKSGVVLGETTITLVELGLFNIEFDANVKFAFDDILYFVVGCNHPEGSVFSLTSVVITITSNLSKPTYSLKRVAYQSASGVYNPAFAYNVEGMTPATLAQVHGNYIRSVLFNMAAYNLTFQMLDKNDQLSRQYFPDANGNSLVITENTDIPIASLTSSLLFLPFYLTFKTAVNSMFNAILQGASNAHIAVPYCGKILYGFPMQVSVKPGLNEAQSWKLLCSPLTNLADLGSIFQSDQQSMQIMGYGTDIPYAGPIQWVSMTQILPPQYHYLPMDQWWYTSQVKDYVDQAAFYQPWQNDDEINVQLQTGDLGNVTITLVTPTGIPVQVWNGVPKTAPSVPNNSLFEVSIVLTGIAEGIYYFIQTSGAGTAQTQAISEPIYVKADWPKTLLLNYLNSFDHQSIAFSTGYTGQIRVPGWIDGFNPKAKATFYEDQPADIVIQNGIPYRTYTMNIGRRGVPDWMIDKVARIMLFDTVTVDGLQISMDSDAKWEGKSVVGTLRKWWKCAIREAINKEGISMATTGSPDDSMFVIRNINTKGFGDGSNGDSVVEVITID